MNILDVTAELMKSFAGKLYWKRITRKLDYKESNGDIAVVLFPHTNEETNYYFLLYLDDFLKQRNFTRAVIITRDDMVKKSYSFFSHNVQQCITARDKKISRLLMFYSLFHFDGRFFVASLTQPYGREQCLQLLGINEVTKEQLVKSGVYQLGNLPNRAAPKIKRKKQVDPAVLAYVTGGRDSHE